MVKVVKSTQSKAVVKANTSTKVVNSKMRSDIMDTTRFVMHETPNPATDGAQKLFTCANAYVSGLLEVYIDGLLQIKGTDYAETDAAAGTFTLVVAPDSDENLRVNYIKAL